MVSCWLHIARLVKQDPGFRIGGPVSSSGGWEHKPSHRGCTQLFAELNGLRR